MFSAVMQVSQNHGKRGPFFVGLIFPFAADEGGNLNSDYYGLLLSLFQRFEQFFNKPVSLRFKLKLGHHAFPFSAQS
ncbi:MAG: hypothetical protein MZV65_45170 [Chromatiales bacterium]|nr:hypothetical protein [Chromatiales bacterium]